MNTDISSIKLKHGMGLEPFPLPLDFLRHVYTLRYLSLDANSRFGVLYFTLLTTYNVAMLPVISVQVLISDKDRDKNMGIRLGEPPVPHSRS